MTCSGRCAASMKTYAKKDAREGALIRALPEFQDFLREYHLPELWDKYGVPDLRPMFEADTRWLAHYGFSAHAVPNPASGLS